LSLGQYLLGVAGLAAIAISLGFAAYRLRGRLLPGWSGPRARLAEAVLTISALLLIAELLGLVGLLNGVVLVVAALLAGAASAGLTGAAPPSEAEPEEPARERPDAAMTLIALALAALVGAHWAIAAQVTLEIGHLNGDDLINHMPFAARFAQEGSITALNFVSPSYLVWLYPANSELLHSVGMLLFDGDLASPLLNLLWLALAFLAAWCFGSRFGAAPQALAGAALLADMPVLVQSQAGTAKNDLFALALLLAAAALLVQASRDDDAGVGLPLIAGLAAGLAAGTKFSLIPPVGALAVGIAWMAGRGERLRPTAIFAGAALATGGFWYLRNLFHAGNPLPWVSEVGPIDLPGLDQSFNSPPDHSVAGYLTDGTVLSSWFEPGLSAQLGPLWPLLALVGVTGLAIGLAQRRHPGLRMASLAGTVALVFYLVQPNGAEGPEGMPELFAYQLRHLVAPLMLGVLTAVSLTGGWSRAARWAVLTATAALTLFFTRRGLEFWEEPSFLAGAILIALIAVAGPAAVMILSEGGLKGRRRAAMVAVAAGLALVLGGWIQARDRDDTRYRAGFPGSYYADFQLSPEVADLRPVYEWAQDQGDARIGTSAALQYGLYDFDLDSRVEFIGVHGPDAGFDRARNCPQWVDAVNEGDYDYVVAAPLYGGKRSVEAGWTRSNPSAERVLSSGPATVFRITAPLDPAACR
jgi:hypothetical protein